MTKAEAIKKAMELHARHQEILGEPIVMTEKMFSIFSLEELIRLNEDEAKAIAKMERQLAKAKKNGYEIRWVVRPEPEEICKYY